MREHVINLGFLVATIGCLMLAQCSNYRSLSNESEIRRTRSDIHELQLESYRLKSQLESCQFEVRRVEYDLDTAESDIRRLKLGLYDRSP